MVCTVFNLGGRQPWHAMQTDEPGADSWQRTRVSGTRYVEEKNARRYSDRKITEINR